ncbi:MAG: hypothetical protein WC606_01905 [Candidatus Absconditabacterales bacterium]|jgi:hypothetical protein
MKKKAIMWCPLTDVHVVKKGTERIQEIVGAGNHIVKLSGSNLFQSLVCCMTVSSVSEIPTSSIFKFATIVVDKETEHLLAQFAKENKMELEFIEIPEQEPGIYHFLSVAVLNFDATWFIMHKPDDKEYTIPSSNSFLGKELKIKGFSLEDAQLALDPTGAYAVSALINLNCPMEDVLKNVLKEGDVPTFEEMKSDFHVRLSDLSAFGEPSAVREKIRTEMDLYELITESHLKYEKTGDVTVPNVLTKDEVQDQLTGINWEAEGGIPIAKIDNSMSLTKLKLSQAGISAHAESLGRIMTLGVGSDLKFIITHGLIVEIRYKDELFFMAYVPQELFEKE